MNEQVTDTPKDYIFLQVFFLFKSNAFLSPHIFSMHVTFLESFTYFVFFLFLVHLITLAPFGRVSKTYNGGPSKELRKNNII